MKLLSHSFLFLCFAVALSSCSTQRNAVTRQPHVEMTSVKGKKAGLSASESTSTAGKKSKSESTSKAVVKKYASLMEADAASLNNVALIGFIDDWYGVPYKYGGKDKKGIDCSSFTCALYQNVYRHELSGTSGSLYTQSKRIKKSELQEGDLVFFKISRGRISHVGVYVINGYFIHASVKAGVVLSSLEEPYYKKYYAGAGRLSSGK